MNTKIYYNNQDVFSGICPTPLASKKVEMIRFGERWGQVDNITLQGQITGCDSMAAKVVRQNQLISGFRYSFQTLEIKDDALSVISYPLIELQGINIGESNQKFIIPFTISLRCYPSGYFSGDFGILNPVNRFEFNESEDGIISLNHTVSAKGFNTSTGDSNAFNNAANWVSNRTGWSSQVLPIFISGFNSNMCIQSIRINEDRLNGVYSCNENYTSDAFNAGNFGVLRYTTEFNSGIEDGICSMGVQGTIRSCKFNSITGARQTYSGFNAFNEAINQFQKITNRTDLSSFPLTKAVSEDTNARLISFNYLYNDDLRPKINIVYNIDFNYDFESDVIEAKITATISNRAAYDPARWNEILTVGNSINLYSVLVPAYNAYVSEVNSSLSIYPLNPNPTSQSETRNEYELKLILSKSFNNKDVAPVGLKTFDYSIAFEPSIHKYSAQPILDGIGSYYLFDLNYISRMKINIDSRALGEANTAYSTVKAIVKSKIEAFMAQYLQGQKKLLEGDTFAETNESFGKKFNGRASYSCESSEFTIP
jgi:hypothetical protein